MPLFAVSYFILILSNFGFPGTFNFVGEFLILVGLLKCSNILLFLCTLPMLLSLLYSLYYFNIVFFGSLNSFFIRYYCDIIRLEFYILSIFSFLTIYFGIYPLILNLFIF